MGGRPIEVMVSGCFDIIHSGHVEFLQAARAKGDYLTVVIPTDDIIRDLKQRQPFLTIAQKTRVLMAMSCVDHVVVGAAKPYSMNFVPEFKKNPPDILAVSDDDPAAAAKLDLCFEHKVDMVTLERAAPEGRISSTELVIGTNTPREVPIRVDLAGGWLDVPRLAQPGGLIVNCAVTPMMRIGEERYKIGGGIGGSAAWAMLNGYDPVETELEAGVGWQDPAVIQETGLCVWKSGAMPELDTKVSGDILKGLMALEWSGEPHVTASLVDMDRNYSRITVAAYWAANGVREGKLSHLLRGIDGSYIAQLEEGMQELPARGAASRRYCGSGWGGYGLYVYDRKDSRDKAVAAHKGMFAIEPYCKKWYK